MNSQPQVDRWRAELIGWSWRGALCAGPSLFWAVMGNYQSVAEIVAMIGGVALFVVGFAAVCIEIAERRPAWESWLQLLKLAVWIKTIGPVCLPLAFAAFSIGDFGEMIGLAVMLPDVAFGCGAIWMTGLLNGMPGDRLPGVDSFMWTLITTLFQGGLISLLLIVITCGMKLTVWLAAPVFRMKRIPFDAVTR